jgi:hypothetical protein
MRRALGITSQASIGVYDCLCVALAEREGSRCPDPRDGAGHLVLLLLYRHDQGRFKISIRLMAISWMSVT